MAFCGSPHLATLKCQHSLATAAVIAVIVASLACGIPADAQQSITHAAASAYDTGPYPHGTVRMGFNQQGRPTSGHYTQAELDTRKHAYKCQHARNAAAAEAEWWFRQREINLDQRYDAIDNAMADLGCTLNGNALPPE